MLAHTTESLPDIWAVVVEQSDRRTLPTRAAATPLLPRVNEDISRAMLYQPGTPEEMPKSAHSSYADYARNERSGCIGRQPTTSWENERATQERGRKKRKTRCLERHRPGERPYNYSSASALAGNPASCCLPGAGQGDALHFALAKGRKG